MQRPWRITEVWQKTLYIVVGFAAIELFLFALSAWGLDPKSWPHALLFFLVNIGYTLVGVRTFRGYREPTSAPRAWWRWTGRPKAGFWLGALHLVALTGGIQDFWPRSGLTLQLPAAVLNIALLASIAFGYLNSSFRLRRHPELWSQRRRQALAQPETE
jgi:hypothetical protein